MLDVENQLWDETLMGDLPLHPNQGHRSYAAPVTVENVGTYLIGGDGNMRRTSDFLAAGSTEWATGPAIPVDMRYPCAVSISQLSFLIIYERNIREYQVDTTNPTSFSGWQLASKFPQLQAKRRYRPGCSKIGDQVVIAGGYDNIPGYLRSSEVLDLTTRTIVYAGDMNSARTYFHMATITMNGEQTVLAFGGYGGGIGSIGSILNSVEQFNTNNNTWTLAPTSMEEARYYYGAVAVTITCPT